MAKTPQKKRSARSSRKRTPRTTAKTTAPSRWRRLKKSLLWLFLVACVVLAGYVVYLDQVVREKFAGNRWSLPANVYADPLELYVGAKLTARQLQQVLQRIGYRSVKRVRQPGEYRNRRGAIQLYTQGFDFWDGHEAAVAVNVRFSEGVVQSITQTGGRQNIDLLRLEPERIGQIHPKQYEDRILMRYAEIPPLLIATLIAVEDRKFFHHWGVNPLAIGRAIIANIRAGKFVQGGSTLTQQLAKNFFLTPARNLWRKFNELIIALLLEAHYDKQEILEAYCNQVFLSQAGAKAIHGFALAARHYFNKPPAQLSIAETALLVGIVKGPSYYHPLKHPQRAKTRRDIVLRLMLEQQVIKQPRYQAALAERLPSGRRKQLAQSRYPAFLSLVKQQLKRDYDEADLNTAGLKIFTTLQPDIQIHAEQAMTLELKQLEKRYRMPAGRLQSAVLVVAPQGGEILALIGGRRTRYQGFNRALHAYRPIGSLIKPAVYLTALMQPDAYTLTTPLNDRAVAVDDAKGATWRPNNYDRREHGDIPLYLALAKSYNLATVQLGLALGLESVILTLRKLGVEKPIRLLPSLLLGATPMSPYEVAQMYQTFAGGGYYAPLRSIRAVLDAQDRPLTRYPLDIEQRYDAASAVLVNHAMQQVIAVGSGRSVRDYVPASIPLAGKTGTTNDRRDSWFAGFGADKVGVVWVGYDDNSPTKLTGASGALRIWGRMMQRMGISGYVPGEVEGVHWVTVDANNNVRLAEHCQRKTRLPYVIGTEPQDLLACDAHKPEIEQEKSWFERWLE